MKDVIVSGIQPSGEMHIGNYLGALKDFVALQDKYQCYFFIADLHSLTENFDPKQKQQQIQDTLIAYLAAGLDPKKSTIFVQSQVPAHTELAWIFNTIVEVGDLFKMTQFKDKTKSGLQEILAETVPNPAKYSVRDAEKKLQEKFDKAGIEQFSRRLKGNVGLLTYPVLQAADILAYKPTMVPVGSDQIQHLEMTNTIARKFNNKYGQTFKEIKPFLKQPLRVMSLTDPEKKMSKSDPSSYVGIFDEPEIIRKKLAKAVTATDAPKGEMPKGVANLFDLLQEFSDKKTLDNFTKQYETGQIKYSELKSELAESLIRFFEPFRTKKAELEKDTKQLHKIVADGAKLAQVVASKTLTEVKQKIGLI